MHWRVCSLETELFFFLRGLRVRRSTYHRVCFFYRYIAHCDHAFLFIIHRNFHFTFFFFLLLFSLSSLDFLCLGHMVVVRLQVVVS